ncbi:hypothetical protein MAR621_03145 [Maribacter dokdonensis]|uniref:hypothetical protein n=1 Tax=Maribacter dokdonensis TaxID=320912 RepID=UPI001B15BD3B|nr:hypothetical protein [Maribacter dokdonensis]CAG2532951.1 hypothetical protein MAR621_03145 [Maribacter dokdonensis]
MKKFNITLSKNFLQKHPKEGTPTFFRQSFESGKKKHTIRGNFEYWADIIDQVQKGEAVLQIKEWIDKPYKSKQELIAVLDMDSGIGYQEIHLTNFHTLQSSIDDKYHYIHQDDASIYYNDGLLYEDFRDWFFSLKSQETHFSGIIIHFTSLRY